MSLSEEQFRLRRTGITATDAVILAGESAHASALDVYLDKIGMSEERPESVAMELGNYMEPMALKLLGREKALEIRPSGTLRHPERSLILATPDGVCGEPVVAIVEAKFVGYYDARRWESEIPPDRVVIQVQQGMAVTGARTAHVVALIGTTPRFYVVEYQDELAESIMAMGEAFWHEHVEARVPPASDGSERASQAVKRLFPKVKGDLFFASPEVEEIARTYFAARKVENASALLRQKCEDDLKIAIGEAYGVAGDGWKATWNESKGDIAWKQAYEALATRTGVSEELEQFRRPGKRSFRCNEKGSKES